MKKFIPSPEILNIAEVWRNTQTLGPGLRAVVWVQGCNRHCPGCVSPEWMPQEPAHLTSVNDLSKFLIDIPDISGLTFSGGEPMLQAGALAKLIQQVREQRDLNTLCFSGFTYEELVNMPRLSPVHKLLSELDVLIDGPYIAELDDNKGLRGSSNQNIIHLTDRLREYDLENKPRQVEFHIHEKYTMMVGVPPHEFIEILESKLNHPASRSKNIKQG